MMIVAGLSPMPASLRSEYVSRLSAAPDPPLEKCARSGDNGPYSVDHGGVHSGPCVTAERASATRADRTPFIFDPTISGGGLE
jgi:hypothetical protein